MTKQEIIREFRRVTNDQSFMTAKQFAKAMGMKTADYAKKRFLTGLDCVDGKYYFIQDIAERIKTMLKEDE